MADFRTFGKNMRQVTKTITRNVDRTVRQVALAVDATVVLATPVDTGRARSNWQVEFDRDASGTIPTYGNSAAQVSQDKAKQKIASYNGSVNHSIHITNNLPYIGKLNQGSSAQAPAGFVEQAVQVGVAAIKTAGKITVNK